MSELEKNKPVPLKASLSDEDSLLSEALQPIEKPDARVSLEGESKGINKTATGDASTPHSAGGLLSGKDILAAGQQPSQPYKPIVETVKSASDIPKAIPDQHKSTNELSRTVTDTTRGSFEITKLPPSDLKAPAQSTTSQPEKPILPIKTMASTTEQPAADIHPAAKLVNHNPSGQKPDWSSADSRKSLESTPQQDSARRAAHDGQSPSTSRPDVVPHTESKSFADKSGIDRTGQDRPLSDRPSHERQPADRPATVDSSAAEYRPGPDRAAESKAVGGRQVDSGLVEPRGGLERSKSGESPTGSLEKQLSSAPESMRSQRENMRSSATGDAGSVTARGASNELDQRKLGWSALAERLDNRDTRSEVDSRLDARKTGMTWSNPADNHDAKSERVDRRIDKPIGDSTGGSGGTSIRGGVRPPDFINQITDRVADRMSGKPARDNDKSEGTKDVSGKDISGKVVSGKDVSGKDVSGKDVSGKVVSGDGRAEKAKDNKVSGDKTVDGLAERSREHRSSGILGIPLFHSVDRSIRAIKTEIAAFTLKSIDGKKVETPAAPRVRSYKTDENVIKLDEKRVPPLMPELDTRKLIPVLMPAGVNGLRVDVVLSPFKSMGIKTSSDIAPSKSAGSKPGSDIAPSKSAGAKTSSDIAPSKAAGSKPGSDSVPVPQSGSIPPLDSVPSKQTTRPQAQPPLAEDDATTQISRRPQIRLHLPDGTYGGQRFDTGHRVPSAQLEPGQSFDTVRLDVTPRFQPVVPDSVETKGDTRADINGSANELAPSTESVHEADSTPVPQVAEGKRKRKRYANPAFDALDETLTDDEEDTPQSSLSTADLLLSTGSKYTYILKPGDSLDSISVSQLDDARLTPLLQRKNQRYSTAGGADILEAGGRLQLPTPAEIKRFLEDLSLS